MPRPGGRPSHRSGRALSCCRLASRRPKRCLTFRDHRCVWPV